MFQVLKRKKNVKPERAYKIKDEIKTFSEKQEQKILCQQNFPYKKSLKDLLQVERNSTTLNQICRRE